MRSWDTASYCDNAIASELHTFRIYLKLHGEKRKDEFAFNHANQLSFSGKTSTDA